MKISTTIAAALMAIAVVAVNAEHTLRRLILGGAPVKKDTKTFTAGLRETIDGDIFCGGALVSSLFVLTSVRCTEDLSPNYASVGTQYLNRTLNGEQIPVIAIHVHKDYDPDTGRFDFVLSELAHPSRFGPINLPNANDSDIQNDKMATVVGWV